jgi:hypothetical protein
MILAFVWKAVTIKEYKIIVLPIVLIGIVWGGGWVQLGPLCTAATNRPIVPAPGDYDDGEILWNDWQGKPKYSENLPQCRFVHHKPHMPAWTRTLVAAVAGQRITAWATAWPSTTHCFVWIKKFEASTNCWYIMEHGIFFISTEELCFQKWKSVHQIVLATPWKQQKRKL